MRVQETDYAKKLLQISVWLVCDACGATTPALELPDNEQTTLSYAWAAVEADAVRSGWT